MFNERSLMAIFSLTVPLLNILVRCEICIMSGSFELLYVSGRADIDFSGKGERW